MIAVYYCLGYRLKVDELKFYRKIAGHPAATGHMRRLSFYFREKFREFYST
jgi:hypothetical protein